MSRVKIPITIKIEEFKYLENYLTDKIGERFNTNFKIIHKDLEKNYMNVEIDLENGTAAYLLGRVELQSPISNYVKELKQVN